MIDDPSRPVRAKLTDVARLAGVSPGTVSNALSGKRFVTEETRKRIEQAIDELSYVPNLTARQMRTGRSNTIGIVSSMPVAIAAGKSKLGFLMELAASVAPTALDFNQALILVPPIENVATALSQLSIDGALVVEPKHDDAALNVLLQRNIPALCIGAPLDGPAQNIPLDHTLIAELLIDHLFACGATDFPMFTGTSDRQSYRAFTEVYLRKMQAAGRPARIIEVSEHEAEQGAADALARELSHGYSFNAVLAPIDAMATGVMRVLRQAGLRVPQDVMVATRYDGLRARQEVPGLTAVDLKLDEIAEIATKALLELIEGNELPEMTTLPRPELVVRGSTVMAPSQS